MGQLGGPTRWANRVGQPGGDSLYPRPSPWQEAAPWIQLNLATRTGACRERPGKRPWYQQGRDRLRPSGNHRGRARDPGGRRQRLRRCLGRALRGSGRRAGAVLAGWRRLSAGPARRGAVGTLRLLCRNAAQAPRRERRRFLSDPGRLRYGHPGVPHRAWRDRHAGGDSGPVRCPRRFGQPADDPPGRARRAHGARGRAAQAGRFLSVPGGRADPDRPPRGPRPVHPARRRVAGLSEHPAPTGTGRHPGGVVAGRTGSILPGRTRSTPGRPRLRAGRSTGARRW